MQIYMCRVSKTDYKKGEIEVTIPELEGKTKSGVMMLAGAYEMPEVGTPVAVLFDRENGALTRGICLGAVWSEDYTPKEPGKGLYRKDFPDGSTFTRAKSGAWEIQTSGCQIKADTSTVTVTAGSDSIVIGNGKVIINTGEIVRS